MTNTPVPAQPPTQVRHPRRAVIRTVVSAVISLLSLLPTIALAAHIGTVPIVAQLLIVQAAVTRVLALPAVEAWLQQYAPWLAAQPQHPFGG